MCPAKLVYELDLYCYRRPCKTILVTRLIPDEDGSKIKKILLLRCIHRLYSDLINNMDHISYSIRVLNPHQFLIGVRVNINNVFVHAPSSNDELSACKDQQLH